MSSVALGLLSLALFFRAILRRRIWIIWYIWYALLLALAAIWIEADVDPAAYTLSDPFLPQFVIAGIVATLALLVFELALGRGGNIRSIALTVIGCTIFVLIGVALGAGTKGFAALTLVGLISTILGWVLALGWLAEPNLTMPGFYNTRFIRAYIDAWSSLRGRSKDADLTDAIPDDGRLGRRTSSFVPPPKSTKT